MMREMLDDQGMEWDVVLCKNEILLYTCQFHSAFKVFSILSQVQIEHLSRTKGDVGESPRAPLYSDISLSRTHWSAWLDKK